MTSRQAAIIVLIMASVSWIGFDIAIYVWSTTMGYPASYAITYLIASNVALIWLMLKH